jgi:hypothetical protein
MKKAVLQNLPALMFRGTGRKGGMCYAKRRWNRTNGNGSHDGKKGRVLRGV